MTSKSAPRIFITADIHHIPVEFHLRQIHPAANMGLIEELVERVSITTALLVAAAAYILYKVCVSVDKHYRLKRLGLRAPRVRHKLPFGKCSFHISIGDG